LRVAGRNSCTPSSPENQENEEGEDYLKGAELHAQKRRKLNQKKGRGGSGPSKDSEDSRKPSRHVLGADKTALGRCCTRKSIAVKTGKRKRGSKVPLSSYLPQRSGECKLEYKKRKIRQPRLKIIAIPSQKERTDNRIHRILRKGRGKKSTSRSF